ncbi:MAG: ABC transporter substrate-binding protein [Gammaproteobacteria bacterium]|nr:ABC transporter substrate-binding protein [Gammaproteobacteria bacterium]
MNIRSGIVRMLALASVLCSVFAAAGVAAQEKVLKVAVHADLKILDPMYTTTYITGRYGLAVYDTLFALDSKFVPQPQMVGDYSVSDDQLTYEFSLRPGLKFHDGAPVRSVDCIASLQRWMQKDPMGQRLAQSLDRLEAVDDDTFRLILKEPYGLVLDSLGKATGRAIILPERVAKTPITEQIKEAIGSGPFIFKKDEWKPGQKAVFIKNPDYVPREEPADFMAGGKVVKVDRVEWLYIPDNNTVLSALVAGEVDYYEAPPLEYIPILESNPDIEVKNIDQLGRQLLTRPNHLHPPFNNPKAREALLYLINQEHVMKAVVGNPKLYMPFCGAFFMCNSENGTEVGSEPLREYDLEKAKALLAEAGYAGEELVVLQPTDRPQYNAATLVLIQALRQAGVKVRALSADWSTIASIRAKKEPVDQGGWNIVITSHGGPTVANPVSGTWFNSRCGKGNPGWPCDEELMGMVDQWASETDAGKRKALIEQIHTRAYKSLPFVPMGQFFQPIAVRKNISGVLMSGEPVYWNIEKL